MVLLFGSKDPSSSQNITVTIEDKSLTRRHRPLWFFKGAGDLIRPGHFQGTPSAPMIIANFGKQPAAFHLLKMFHSHSV